MGGRLPLNDEFFYYDYRDLFLQAYNAALGQLTLQNASKVVNYGDQLDLAYAIAERTRVMLSVGYLHAQIRATVLQVGITQSEVGRMLDIASANMAPLAAGLTDRKLIVRDALDRRRRSHGLQLSDSGRRLLQRVRKIVDELEAGLLECIPAAQRAAFLNGLKTVAKAMGD